MATFATESHKSITAEFRPCFPQMTGLHTHTILPFLFQLSTNVFGDFFWGDMTKCLFTPDKVPIIDQRKDRTQSSGENQ